ncbi:MAG: PilN domain-containing protein [Nitrospinota bacterium]|nr:PilN domain-containing protein [Nitrospinota bacterium]
MIRINLVARHIPKVNKLIQRQAVYLITLVAIAIFVSMFWMVSAFANKSNLQSKLDVLKLEQTRLIEVKKKNAEFILKKERREGILKTIKILESRRVGPGNFLDYLNIILPIDVWLTKVTETNTNISIIGYTFSPQAVAELMRSMENSEHFSNVELTSIEKQNLNEQELKSFTITCNWDVEIVPASVPDKKGGKS